jgi:peptidoglycan/LPS O-acetylase OafA/YrhL
MPFTNGHSGIDQSLEKAVEAIDLEARIQTDDGLRSTPIFNAPSISSSRKIEVSSVLQKFLSYPSQASLKIRPTSWLDGVRGTAALGVYIFHTMGCWAPLVPAWHSDENQTYILQLPILRTFFVSGGAAVSLFFALSGYVLTHKSLRWMRRGAAHQVYPTVASSMFRRGFRLYLPPILLTFCEMVASRFGFTPPLNFTFVPEANFFIQFVDWLSETNRFVNPIHNFQRAMQGFVTHPKYDAVIWTIPIEFYGSFVCYILLLLLARVPGNGVRIGLLAVFSIFCLCIGSWNLFCFSTGMLIADLNLGQEETDATGTPKPSRHIIIWGAVFTVAFYVAGFPTLSVGDANQKPMPGFEILHSLTPMGLNMEDHSRFWWSLSGVSLLLSISQLPRLKIIFETNFCQYIGKISFSLYLIHEFCIILFGLALQKFLLGLAGLEEKANTFVYWILCVIWGVLFTLPVFALAAQVERWVDVPSVNFARWLEARCLRWYKSFR